MTSNKMNQWFDAKWAIALGFYLLVLLVISACAYLNVLPTQFASFPAYDALGHFILMGIASYLSYLTSRGRSFWVGNCSIPLGPFVVSLCVVGDEMLQHLSPYRTVSPVDVAASFSGIVLFYRLARVQYVSHIKY